MDKSVLSKAAQQALCEHLGFDEGKAYFSLLEKKSSQKDIESAHSHSKVYRIFNSLLHAGAVAKVVKENEESPKYLLLPPTFLYDNPNIPDEEIIEYLEKMYLGNYADSLMNTYLEITLRFRNRLTLFLLKHFMKKYAILFLGNSEDFYLYQKLLPKEKFEKIIYCCKRSRVKKPDPRIHPVDDEVVGDRRIRIFDGNILVETLRLPSDNFAPEHPERTKFTGFFLSKKFKVKEQGSDEDYIERIENEIRKIIRLPKK